jgi:predicted DNA-binding transcriptional regulator YafY
VTIPIESIEQAAGQLLRLGAQAKVVEPAALRRELLGRIDAIAALYRVRGRSSDSRSG